MIAFIHHDPRTGGCGKNGRNSTGYKAAPRAVANGLRYRYHQAAWFLHAAEIYCDAIKRFAADLSTVRLKSRGFLAFRDYLTAYAEGGRFALLLTDTNTLTARLSNVTHCVLVHDNSFTVRSYESEADYSAEIEAIFEKFKQGAVKDYKVQYSSFPEDMNHIEAKILEFVVELTPSLFSCLVGCLNCKGNFLNCGSQPAPALPLHPPASGNCHFPAYTTSA